MSQPILKLSSFSYPNPNPNTEVQRKLSALRVNSVMASRSRHLAIAVCLPIVMLLGLALRCGQCGQRVVPWLGLGLGLGLGIGLGLGLGLG